MGADAGDYDGSGRAHLLVGNFSNQMLGLYHNEGTGLFVDEAPSSTVGRASLLSLAFGVFFFDYDLDGYPDIFAANGHIDEEINRVQPKVKYQQSPLLFRNLGQRRFENVSAAMGAEFNRPIVARGAAYADIDHDGDLDVIISTNNGPAYLFRNDGGNRNHWIEVLLVGKTSNRDGYGAKVRVKAGAMNSVEERKGGMSYQSAHDPRLHFGLGLTTEVENVEVRWPSQVMTTRSDVPANQCLSLTEGK